MLAGDVLVHGLYEIMLAAGCIGKFNLGLSSSWTIQMQVVVLAVECTSSHYFVASNHSARGGVNWTVGSDPFIVGAYQDTKTTSDMWRSVDTLHRGCVSLSWFR